MNVPDFHTHLSVCYPLTSDEVSCYSPSQKFCTLHYPELLCDIILNDFSFLEIVILLVDKIRQMFCNHLSVQY